jgi:hypothetical protein
VAHDEDVYYWCLVAEKRHQGQPGDHGVPQSDDTVTAASSEQVQRPLQVETANTLTHTDISLSAGVHQTANTLPHTDISRSAGVHQTANTLTHTDFSRRAGVHLTANTLAHTDISRVLVCTKNRFRSDFFQSFPGIGHDKKLILFEKPPLLCQ